jgi:hypothetical protein
MFFAPTYSELKLIASVSVNVFPLEVIELPARLTAHCELYSVLELPNIAGIHADAASFNRFSVPVERL